MHSAISAYIICGGEYLLLRRCSALLRGNWQMVTGKIEENETAWQAALREIAEETGLVPDRFYSADALESFYMVERDQIMHVPAFVGFVQKKTSIRLSPEEHDAYEWLPFEQARERLVFAEQRRVITQVEERFVQRTPLEVFAIRGAS